MWTRDIFMADNNNMRLERWRCCTFTLVNARLSGCHVTEMDPSVFQIKIKYQRIKSLRKQREKKGAMAIRQQNDTEAIANPYEN